MNCQNGKLECNPTLNRTPLTRTKEDEIYGQLWAEIEPPKLLTEKTTATTQEVRQ